MATQNAILYSNSIWKSLNDVAIGNGPKITDGDVAISLRVYNHVDSTEKKEEDEVKQEEEYEEVDVEGYEEEQHEKVESEEELCEGDFEDEYGDESEDELLEDDYSEVEDDDYLEDEYDDNSDLDSDDEYEKEMEEEGEEEEEEEDDDDDEEEEETRSDSNGFYLFRKNEVMASNRFVYEVVESLGKGAHGTALKCLRRVHSGGKTGPLDWVAVKMSKSGEDKRRWARLEAEMLRRVESPFCVQLLDSFRHGKHFCIVLELMDVSLSVYLRQTSKVPLAVIRRVASDLLKGLAKLQELDIIHADIKPDNIMLDRRTFRTKFIDFGLAHYVHDQYREPYIQTRYYRAPEIILNYMLNYRTGIDVWSLGCVLGEMLTKRALYPGNCGYDMLRYFIDAELMTGNSLMIKYSHKRNAYFKQNNEDKTTWTLKSVADFVAEADAYGVEAQRAVVRPAKKYSAVKLDSMQDIDLPKLKGRNKDAEFSDRQQFVDLLRRMLKIIPEYRISPNEALQHNFISMAHLAPYRHLKRVKTSYESMDMIVPQSMTKQLHQKRLLNEVSEGGSSKKCKS